MQNLFTVKSSDAVSFCLGYRLLRHIVGSDLGSCFRNVLCLTLHISRTNPLNLCLQLFSLIDLSNRSSPVPPLPIASLGCVSLVLWGRFDLNDSPLWHA